MSGNGRGIGRRDGKEEEGGLGAWICLLASGTG